MNTVLFVNATIVFSENLFSSYYGGKVNTGYCFRMIIQVQLFNPAVLNKF